MTQAAEQSEIQKAWVVFSGKTDLDWLRVLKPGFRHCFVVLKDGERWITLDPLSNYMEVLVHHHVSGEFDLPRWLERRGMRVLPADLTRLKKPAPWMLFTCVEAVKRVLGVHKFFIFTPWQLYRYLQGQSKVKGEIAWEV